MDGYLASRIYIHLDIDIDLTKVANGCVPPSYATCNIIEAYYPFEATNRVCDADFN